MSLLDKLNTCNIANSTELHALLKDLLITIEHQGRKITSLESEHDNLRGNNQKLEERVRKCERYSSLFCLTFLGLPSEPQNPLPNVLNFINQQLGVPILQEDVAACHQLPGNDHIKPIIVKFLYAYQRDAVFANRFKLRQTHNHKVLIVERLPEEDRKVMDYAKTKEGLITSSNKCQVILKRKDSQDPWTAVNHMSDVDNFCINYTASKPRQNYIPQNNRNTSTIYCDAPNNTPNFANAPTRGTKRRNERFSEQLTSNNNNNLDSKMDRLMTMMETFITSGLSPSPPSKANKMSENDNLEAASTCGPV